VDIQFEYETTEGTEKKGTTREKGMMVRIFKEEGRRKR
jgi:hypothetical protein